MDIKFEIIKIVVQFLLLGIVGGGVSWYYARLQKNREFRTTLIRELSSLHGRFISLRFRANALYITRSDERTPSNLPINSNEMNSAEWDNFREACNLLGEFAGIRPLIVRFYPGTNQDMNLINSKYQEWRRQFHARKPVFQDAHGKSGIEYDEVQEIYRRLIGELNKGL